MVNNLSELKYRIIRRMLRSGSNTFEMLKVLNDMEGKTVEQIKSIIPYCYWSTHIMFGGVTITITLKDQIANVIETDDGRSIIDRVEEFVRIKLNGERDRLLRELRSEIDKKSVVA